MEKIGVIVGSMQQTSRTRMAARVVCDKLSQLGVQVLVIDPLHEQIVLPSHASWPEQSSRFQALMKDCAGVVMVTPEYDGSFSAVMKLIIESLGYPSVLTGKWVELIGVAAGDIGAVKALEHLRSICGHIGMVVLPQSFSIRRADLVFEMDSGKCIDGKVLAQLENAAAGVVNQLRSSPC